MKRGTEVKNFGFRIPKELLEKFRYVAHYDCRSVSSMARIAIEELVSAFEQENGDIKL